MAKRSRPLTQIDWDLLDPTTSNANTHYVNQNSPNKRPRHSRDDENEDDDDVEEVTVNIEEHDREDDLAYERHGMAILNAMNVTKQHPITTVGTTRAALSIKAIEENIPSVHLDEHYTKLYDKIMNTRFEDVEYDDNDDDYYSRSEEDEQDVDDLILDNADSSNHAIHSHSRKNNSNRRYNRGGGDDDEENTQNSTYSTRHRRECFLCAWGNRFHDGIKARHVNALNDIIENQYGQCDNVELALQLHLYYKKHVYRRGTGMIMLTKEVALEHIEGNHSLSAKLYLGQTIKECRKLQFNYVNQIFKENGKHDKHTFDCYHKTVELILKMYDKKIEKMLFNQGASSQDTASMGRLTNIRPEFKQVRSKKNRQKTVTQIQRANDIFGRGFES